MGHPILDHEKAALDREASEKRQEPRSNDAPKKKPLHAKKPDVLKGHPPAHGERDEDRGHEETVGNE